ncbi:hypothetical protein llap_18839 [Limosa lapponica baueri]|uniref:Uncharacterized protein n=1 Tax=Limosa lapponica baueri TaxID=1758121 RepID=A0A2I0TAN0_LIMLA|nr:hypothetical protein llap_18839 [Limosa lapponica baueri]
MGSLQQEELSFALSILGDPMVMLWDEPSVSMDLKGQRRMWYIGSLEDLKRKFGMSYHLEVKMMDAGQSDALHAEILHLFPRAARQERTASLLIYKIPMEDVLPLSQSFSKLEAAKQNFRLEEYSLSLHTLQQEWMLSLLFLPLMFIVYAFMMNVRSPEVPYSSLGQLDDPPYNATGVTVAFTPVTTTTRQIMNKVALNSVMTGIKLEAMDNEKTLEKAWISNNEIIGVVFKDNSSYHLRFAAGKVPTPNENLGYIDDCYNFSSQYCDSPKYWYNGFLSLQSSIDAAIIEVVTNHSVWEEMKSIAGVRMKSRSVITSITLEYSYFMITVVMCFSPFMYFLSMNIVREKKKLKVLMKTMGLQDIAFWLSWSLLYAVYVMVLSLLLTALVVQDAFYLSSFPAVLLLFFLYGLACIHLVFMLCSLLRTSKLAGSMGFLLTFLFGCLSLAVLIENLPEPLKWFLGLFCPFAFNVGIAKVFHLEKYGIGFSFSNLMEESYFLFSTYIMLVFDSVLYVLLAVYFDKVLPAPQGNDGLLYSVSQP